MSSQDMAQLLLLAVLVVGLVGGAGAIALGVYRYNRNENWHRLEFLRKAVKEFEQDPEIWKALKILDFEEYRDYDTTYNGDRLIFRVTDQQLCNALATHNVRVRKQKEMDRLRHQHSLDDAAEKTYLIETTLRDWFNKMLNGLEHFGYLLESGMFGVEDLRPWMSYWIRLIADLEYRRAGSSRVYDQLYTYIHDCGFFGVLTLFERFGYRILRPPYHPQDFADLSKGLQEFDPKTALSLAKSSYLIYQDMSYVAEITQLWAVDMRTSFRYFNARDRNTQAFMIRTPQCMMLAFRGTQEMQDWRTNIQTRLNKFAITTQMEDLNEDHTPPKGQVHRGFQTAWTSIESDVIQQINRWNAESPAPLPLLITGHSLGGALATVAAASLVKQRFSVDGVYTFGQPRVGDIVFAAEIGLALRGKLFRFVNNNDIVPHIPPPFLPWNPLRLYVHLGQQYYFNAFGTMSSRPNSILRFLNFWLGLTRDAFEPGFSMVNDHRMEYYISRLQKVVDLQQRRDQLDQDNYSDNVLKK